ncbi:hypothetical protein TorRG33x02_253250 [Trema orientale]|uniref:Uncharacterized protein n=1 Tax=Trema orientale TaxID=63057 RepID=A0A2P5DF50_TREOI|nr:hypothetical protein TorRG33x02_253250 [Trema orientale]
MQMRVIYDREHLSAPPEGWMGSYQRYFTVGLHFPFHSLIRACLIDWEIAFGKLSLNVLWMLVGFFVLWRKARLRDLSVPVSFYSLDGRLEKRQCSIVSEDELFNLKTVLVMDTKEHHLKGLLASSMLAFVRWHPYLVSNPILRRHSPTQIVHPLVNKVIPEVEESLVVICETLILQLPSSNTASPRGVGLVRSDGEQWTKKKSDHHWSWPQDQEERLPVEDRPVVPESSAVSTPRVSPLRVMPPLQPRPRTPLLLERQCPCLSFTKGFSASTSSANHLGQVLPSAFRESDEPSLYRGLSIGLDVARQDGAHLISGGKCSFSSLWFLKNAKGLQKEVEDARDNALDEKKKADEEMSKAKETEGQLGKDLECLQAETVADIAQAHGDARQILRTRKSSRIYAFEASMTITSKSRPATGVEPPEDENSEAAKDTVGGGIR